MQPERCPLFLADIHLVYCFELLLEFSVEFCIVNRAIALLISDVVDYHCFTQE